MSEQKTLTGKAEVLTAMAEHPAVKAIVAWRPESLVDAKFDRGELTLFVDAESVREAASTLKAAGYNFFEDLTAVDWNQSGMRFQISYHLLSHSLREHIRLATRVTAEEPVVDSITPVWPSANYYEREVFDLFGIRFEGHGNLRRIMLPEEFVGHPLRKDFPVEGYR